MAASITGVFTIVDRASAPMRRMEQQALKTMVAIEGVGHAQDKQSASHQSAGRRMEETTRVMRNAERQATTTGRSFDQMGRHMNNSNGAASGFIGTISKVNEVFRFLAGAFAAMKLPTMVIGFTVLAQAIGQLAGGAVALVPALAQASAAMAALPQTASAAVQGLGVFKLAMGGVQNALKAGMAIQQNSTQVMQDAAQAHIQAVHGVQEAEFSLATSQRTVQQAQQALTQARRDAIRNLTDLRLAAMGADLSQRRAALSLREAQQNLAQAAVNPGTTDLQMQDLNLAVSEARLQVRSAGVDRNRAHVDAHRAAQRGVDRNLQVIQAQQGVIQSMHAERDAVYELQQAQVALAREMQRGTGPIQNWRQALAQLSPQAQSFVKHIVSLQPAFKGLRAAAGSEMFPGFEKALNNLMRLMPVAKSVSRDTGGAIGGIAEALSGRLAGRSGDLKSIGESNVQIIRRMGLGAGNLGSALLDLMVAAKPFTSWLTHTIYMGTEWISKWSRARRESGAWADMLDKTRARLKQFADIAHNLWEVLTNVLKAATPLGDKLWSGFDQATKGWAQFAQSTGGQSKMRHWFDALYPGIHALAKLTEDLLKAWAHITVNPGFATTINNLDKAVPALQRLFTAGTNLGPGLANTLSSIAQTLSDLPFSSLQLLLDVIDNLSKLLDFIIRKVPGAKYLLAGLLLGPMIVKGLNFVRGMRDAWADIFGMWSRNRGGPPGMGGPMGSPMGGPGGGGGGGGGFRRAFGRFGGTRAMTEAEQATLTAGGRVAGATEEGMVAVEGAGLLGKFGGRFPRAAARLGRLPGIGRLLGPAAEGAGVLGKAAEGGGLLGKAAGLGKFAMPALGVAAKFALPLMALQGLLAFGTFKGNVGQRLQNVASSFSFGLVHAPVTDAMKRQQGQQDAASYVSHLTGGEQGPHNIHEAQMRIGAIRRQVGRIRSRDMAGTVNPMTGQVIPGHIGTKDLATIKTLNRELKDERKNLIAVYDAQDSQKAQEFGSKLSGIWSVYHKSTKDTGKATKQTVSDIENQMSHMHRAGRTQLAQQAYDWTKEFARTHKGMSGEMKQAREDILNHLRQIGDHATVINGQILTSTSQVWSQIGQGLSDPIEKAREKVAKGFTRMQREAIKALTDMGMTRGQAEAYVAGTEAMNAGSDMSKTRSQRIAGAINAATGTTGGSGGAGSYGGHGAKGMRIPGQGTLDTVPLMLGMAAPGELIVNRHTEDRVRRRYGVDLGREVAGETRAHSAPANATPHYGIMPGFATGGRLGNAASMIAAADAINAHHFPYVWGGGHNPNFTGPYDCSGSVSAVLHAGGVLNSPVTSGSLMGMFDPGPGEVTIYANPQHTYMSIGSRFFGTSTMNPKGGAGWFAGAPRPGFVVRHVPTGGRGSAGQTQAIQDLAAQLGQSVINAPDLGPGMAGGVGQVGVNAVAAALNDRISGAGGGGINATAYGGGGNLRGWLTRALRITGHYSSANLAGLTRMAMGESSGNPNAVQRIHDINSGHGGRNLARGLLQTIPSTFSAYSMTGHNNIMDPVDNAIASIRYQFAKYGRIVGHAGYATGGRIPEWGGWHAQGGRFNVSRPTIFGAGEAGPETVSISRGSGGGRTPVQVHIAHIAYHREGDIKEAIKREMESLADDLDLVGTEGD